MPLIHSKSKKAFSKNVEVEMKAGKPQDQSLAIAYSIKRGSKKKKMAQGGEITAKAEKESTLDNAQMPRRAAPKHDPDGDARIESRKSADSSDELEFMEDKSAHIMHDPDGDLRKERRAAIDETDPMALEMDRQAHARHEERLAAHGAMANADDARDDRDLAMMAEGGDIVSHIMKKRKMMADGGMVDLEKNSEESANEEDQMSFDAIKKEQYDDSQISAQPEDSNEHGDKLSDEDENDDVGSIRKKMRMKARLA